MALFETLSALLSSKAVAAAATLTMVSGTAAGATGALPDGLQTAFDEIAGVSQLDSDTAGEDDTDELEAEVDDVTAEEGDTTDTDEVDAEESAPLDDTVETDDEANERSDNATQVLSDLGDGCMPEDDDCDFGQVVSDNARANGEAKAAEGQARADENGARRGPSEGTVEDDPEADAAEDDEAPAETDEVDEGDDETDETDTDEVSEGAAADSDDRPGASNRPDGAGR